MGAPSLSSPKEAALFYAKSGISVIPVQRNKQPLISWGQFCDRIATPEEIEAWYKQWPDANVGIVTGPISNLAVIDVEKGGDISWIPKETAHSKTGGGGYHFFFRYPPEGIGNSTKKVAPLTDIKAARGFVVAAPSIHQSGVKYEWVRFDQILDFPKHLISKPTNLFDQQHQVKDWDVLETGALEGSRNDTAAKVAGKLLRSIQPSEWDTVAWPAFSGWNTKNKPPLSNSELRAVFDSIKKKAVLDQRAPVPREIKEESLSRITFTEALDLGDKELLSTKTEDCVSFGYSFLDDVLTGIFPSELVLLGGETGTGKTSMVMHIARRVAERGRRVFIFALEDRVEEYALKAIFYRMNLAKRRTNPLHPGYSWNLFRRNEYKDPEFLADKEAAKNELKNDNMVFLRSEERMNFEKIREIIDDEVKRGTALFVIDHLHTLDLDSSKSTRAEYIENLMNDLKVMQRRNGARIIIVAHYRKINGQIPTMDAFKDSSSMVQNASYVINLYRSREIRVDEKKKTKDDTAEAVKKQKEALSSRLVPTMISIPKSRNPNGESIIDVVFDKDAGDYVVMAPQELQSTADAVKPAVVPLSQLGGPATDSYKW